MAKLLKASTARARAEAVDKKKRYLDCVVAAINGAVAEGETSISTFIREEFETDVTNALLDAGYELTYTGGYLGAIYPPEKPGFWSRVFGTESAVPQHTYLGAPYIKISWAGIPEVEDEYVETV